MFNQECPETRLDRLLVLNPTSNFVHLRREEVQLITVHLLELVHDTGYVLQAEWIDEEGKKNTGKNIQRPGIGWVGLLSCPTT